MVITMYNWWKSSFPNIEAPRKSHNRGLKIIFRISSSVDAMAWEKKTVDIQNIDDLAISDCMFSLNRVCLLDGFP